MTLFAFENKSDKNQKIKNASKHIISLIKNKSANYQEGMFDKLVLIEKKLFPQREKISIIQSIKHFVGGFIKCEEENGIWIDKYFECEQIQEEFCIIIGWKYNKCSWACRHNNTNLCLFECRSVCSL